MFSLFSEPKPLYLKVQKFVNSLTMAEVLDLYIAMYRGSSHSNMTLQESLNHAGDIETASDDEKKNLRKSLETELIYVLSGTFLIH